MARTASRPKARYELRAFARSPRSRRGEVPVRTYYFWTNDPHAAAVELYRVKRSTLARDWRVEALDHGAAPHTRLASVISYDDLVRRAGSYRAPSRDPQGGSRTREVAAIGSALVARGAKREHALKLYLRGVTAEQVRTMEPHELSRLIYPPLDRPAPRGSARDLQPLSEDERALMQHITMWGSKGYPIERRGRGWVWRSWRGVKGSPIVYKTRAEAVRAFEGWERLAGMRYAAERREKAEREAAGRRDRR